MIYETIVVPHFPKLAWFASVDERCTTLHVYHGDCVEVSDRWFVEGVWDGDLEKGQFTRTECFYGSGGVVDALGVTFVTSASTVDSIYYCVRQGSYNVSNSLALLLGAVNDQLRTDNYPYHLALDSVLKGIFDYQSNIPTEQGSVSRILFSNFHITSAGCRLVPKPRPAHFDCYRTYVTYLDDKLSAVFDNMRSSRRGSEMDLFSTQSRGYDSTAINALAVKYGIDRVFSCTQARDKKAFYGNERGDQPSDDGTLIGNSLGFQCIGIDRLSFEKNFPDEALYLASHHNLKDVNLREINDHVNRTALLLTGVRGEVWYGPEFYKKKKWRSDSLMKFDMAGHGLSEVRLHTGIVHFPVPFLGAQSQEEIHRITNSKEMDPWRLGKTYDRPIPRRIAEERGVGRELFGFQKLNTTVAFHKPMIPITEGLREEFLAYCIDHKMCSRAEVVSLPIVQKINEAIHYKSPTKSKYLYYSERAISKVVKRPVRMGMLMQKLTSGAFVFAVNRLADEYRDRLSRML